MVNEFEKAENELKNVEQKEEPKQETKSERQEIDVDTISEANYINLPNSEQVGEETPKLQIKSFFRQAGRWQKPKDPTEDQFWTGLVLKGKNGEPDQTQDEANLEVVVDGKDAIVQLKSWELFYKVLDLVKYCKTQKIMFKEQVISFKRIATGKKTANQNWELIVHSLGIKIVGVSKTESKVVKL